MTGYTVSVMGYVVRRAKELGYHAYYASGVTAIEIKARSKANARKIATGHGWHVLYIFI